jgi:flagellar biosynthesis protein FlhF
MMGISKKLATKIANRLDDQEDSAFAFEKAKEMLTKVLPVMNDDLLEYGGVVALVGPTGVGKTTTIAKLAAKFSLKHGANEVALITTDNYRIGAHEQIATYGKLLGVPVRVASNAEELRDHINSFNDRRLVLIDTAGMSQRDMRLADQIQTLKQEDIPIKTYLVMSAATQYKSVNEIINAFKVFEPESSILTKLDETATQGSILSSVIEHQLPISFMTNGQQVPEDIYIPDAPALIEECSASIDEETDTDNEWIAEGYA